MGARLSRAVGNSRKSAEVHKARPGPPASVRSRDVNAQPSHEELFHRSGQWGELLKGMSGAISSRTWHGTVGTGRLADSSRHDASSHVASRSEGARQKMPKKKPAKSTLGTSEPQHEVDIPGRGSLTQNQILDIYRFIRAKKGVIDLDVLAQHYKVSGQDMTDMARFSRPFMARFEHGIARGFFDPENGVERFEDLR